MGPSFKISSLLLFHRVRYVCTSQAECWCGFKVVLLYYFLIHANNNQSIPYYFHFRPKVGPLKGKKRFQVSLNLKPSILKYLSSKPARNQQHLHLPPTRLDITKLKPHTYTRERETRATRDKKNPGKFLEILGGWFHSPKLCRALSNHLHKTSNIPASRRFSTQSRRREGEYLERRPTSPRRTRHRHLVV